MKILIPLKTKSNKNRTTVPKEEQWFFSVARAFPPVEGNCPDRGNVRPAPVGNAALSVPLHRQTVHGMTLKKIKLKMCSNPNLSSYTRDTDTRMCDRRARLTVGSLLLPVGPAFGTPGAAFPTRIVRIPGGMRCKTSQKNLPAFRGFLLCTLFRRERCPQRSAAQIDGSQKPWKKIKRKIRTTT